MRISDWSSDVCSSDLGPLTPREHRLAAFAESGDGGLMVVGPAQHPQFLTQHDVGVLRAEVRRAVGGALEIGRASCRERVCQCVSVSVVAVSLEKKSTSKHHTSSLSIY